MIFARCPRAVSHPTKNCSGEGEPEASRLSRFDEVLSRLEFLKDLGRDTRMYDQVWTQIKAN